MFKPLSFSIKNKIIIILFYFIQKSNIKWLKINKIYLTQIKDNIHHYQLIIIIESFYKN